ncbi:MAG: S1-like domain-containing RNA-binding protein [bacterium]
MAILGKLNRLTVLKDSSPGLYLDGGELGEILLPGDAIPKGAGPGDVLEVFLYRDSEDRLVATTLRPSATVGDFAALKVTEVHPRIGAFLDWGLRKDLLLPNAEQERHVQVGDMVVVHVFIDHQTERIIATTRLQAHIDHSPPPYKTGYEVSLLIAGETPLGYTAVINNSRLGLLYRSELSTPLEIGQRCEGFVRAIRPDGKIDLGLDPQGYQRVAPLANRILAALHSGGGHLPCNDSSTPEEIRAAFQTSKKAFKQALGHLYRQRLIDIEEEGIGLRPGKTQIPYPTQSKRKS